ncbi:MAG: 3-keto-5-aminohexanoate cleavage protein [Steroidobacteraceae bacterium]|jgi:uncharacterized protein (DUF849 family)|nr:3-keto-5-aminohexanoate cleavage protein [Steroidobacteraceae bacterium]
MRDKVILTCAVTGAGDTVGKHPGVPVTPGQIAAACVEAAQAGAAIAHVHVRDPKTGKGGRDPALFREVVARVRDSGTDIVLNLTAGMGGQLNLHPDDPSSMVEGTDLATPAERMRHVEELLPEMCTLDCGSMNFAQDVVINRVRDLEKMAAIAQRLGVKPELEVFDLGQIEIAKHLIAAGLVPGRPLFQLCMGIPWGAPATTEAMVAMKAALPPNADWAAFAISRMEFPWVAQAALLGGNCRVGLEDNLYLGKGQLATNGQLVERAVRILDSIGFGVMTPAEARAKLDLRKRG